MWVRAVWEAWAGWCVGMDSACGVDDMNVRGVDDVPGVGVDDSDADGMGL